MRLIFFFELTLLDVLNILDITIDVLRSTEKVLEPSEVENLTQTSEISERVLSTYLLSKIFLSLYQQILLP